MEHLYELFLLKCAAIKANLSSTAELQDMESTRASHTEEADAIIKEYTAQIDLTVRQEAARMAEYYRIFYMLENFIRDFVSEVVSAEVGEDWWETSVPPAVQDAAKRARERELSMGVTPRSVDMINYITFGELGEIMKTNWKHFGGTINQRGLENVLARLNTLRGPIMHCGTLAEDEVLRLKLSVRDWFKLFEVR